MFKPVFTDDTARTPNTLKSIFQPGFHQYFIGFPEIAIDRIFKIFRYRQIIINVPEIPRLQKGCETLL